MIVASDDVAASTEEKLEHRCKHAKLTVRIITAISRPRTISGKVPCCESQR